MSPDKLNVMASNMESLAESDHDLYIRERDELVEVASYLRQCAQADAVAWCRYVFKHEGSTRIVLCDSDADGAFKVYAHPQPKQAGVPDWYLRARTADLLHLLQPWIGMGLSIPDGEKSLVLRAISDIKRTVDAPHPPSVQSDAVEALHRLVVAIIDDEGDDPDNAPGHAHSIPGIWDDDNEPAIAGKPCEKCAAWSNARAVLSVRGVDR